MNQEQRPISKEIESLLKKAAEANTIIVSETSKFLSKLSKSELKPGDMAMVRKKLFTDAINGLIKLNLQYTSNLIDMGVAISKSINQHVFPNDEQPNNSINTTGAETAPNENSEASRAFELKTTTEAGGAATTAFLLHSDKNELINCTILHSSFVDENDGETLLPAEVLFNPQAFEMTFGSAQRIDVSIKTALGARPGQYRSHITIHGFEQTYFDILLQVLPGKTVEVTPPAPVIETNKIAKPVPERPARKGKQQRGSKS